jgi:hypothetical protein
MDEISKGFFWIPDFRHIFPIFDTLYGRPFVFRFTFLSVYEMLPFLAVLLLCEGLLSITNLSLGD